MNALLPAIFFKKSSIARAEEQSALGFSLLNNYQRDFPLCPAPFARIAEELETPEETVLEHYCALRQSGFVSRIGAVFAPNKVGVSTLAALSVSPHRLHAVAQQVSFFPEVNHNYEREHTFNLWFVVTSSSPERLQEVIARIEATCELPVLQLPLEEAFHIDLGFHLEKGHQRTPRKQHQYPPPAASFDFVLDAKGQELVNALQGGIALVSNPYQLLAQQTGCSESWVLDTLNRWVQQGIVKRFGVVVRHHELGFTANAMLVHDIPDELVSDLGHRIGTYPGITLCYRRPRREPLWHYNLFCMVHGQDRATVLQKIDVLRAHFGLEQYAHAVLFSTTRYKQQGAYYVR